MQDQADEVPLPTAPFEIAFFGGSEFTDEEQREIQIALERNLSVEDVNFRPGPGGSALLGFVFISWKSWFV